MQKVDKFKQGVSCLSWAYNEEDAIKTFLEQATLLMESAVEDYEIILIDDGSTDRTYEWVKNNTGINDLFLTFEKKIDERREKGAIQNLRFIINTNRLAPVIKISFCPWQRIILKSVF